MNEDKERERRKKIKRERGGRERIKEEQMN